MIIAAVIKQNNTIYSIPQPARHNDIIRYMVEECGLKPPITGEQGFLTENGMFLIRGEALYIAERDGQIKKKHPPFHQLLSEDIW